MARVPIRCAIYTRKSSEEGLDQAFNTLHAQREACEAYIKSQVGEGWVLLSDHYDDGGFSGGGLKRPGLQRLMRDVAAKRIDTVLVYKVDRLTRSLPDFVKMVEAFDKQDVSFVSITQAFNTTTSMGRLTLNMLLSFAQFEREVTGERIRDKIAASKAKGMWMGGLVPLGYEPPADRNRALVVNQREAATVRLMFAKLLELGSVGALQTWLRGEGVRSKRRTSTRGRLLGDCDFSRGALRHLLSNRLYIGEISHKGLVHPGRHEAILDPATFHAAQAVLAEGSKRRREHVSRADRALLVGRLFDVDGQAMEPLFGGAGKNGGYFYYGSPTRLGGVDDPADDAIRRVPAHAVDAIAEAWTKRLLDKSDLAASDVRGLIGRMEIHPAAVHLVVRVDALPGRLSLIAAKNQLRRVLQPTEQVLTDPSHAGLLRVVLPVRLVLRGGRRWLTARGGQQIDPPAIPNPKLIQRLRTAHADLAANGMFIGARTAAVRTRAPSSQAKRRTTRLAFLAPDLQRAILRGEVQTVPTADLPLSWAAQRQLLLATDRAKPSVSGL
jgi:site-specific DNA recombinase